MQNFHDSENRLDLSECVRWLACDANEFDMVLCRVEYGFGTVLEQVLQKHDNIRRVKKRDVALRVLK